MGQSMILFLYIESWKPIWKLALGSIVAIFYRLFRPVGHAPIRLQYIFKGQGKKKKI